MHSENQHALVMCTVKTSMHFLNRMFISTRACPVGPHAIILVLTIQPTSDYTVVWCEPCQSLTQIRSERCKITRCLWFVCASLFIWSSAASSNVEDVQYALQELLDSISWGILVQLSAPPLNLAWPHLVFEVRCRC